MKIIEPSIEIAPYGIRAMTMIARSAKNGLGDHQRTLLTAVQTIILHTDIDIDKLDPISPKELAEHFNDAALNRQLIQGMVVMSIVDDSATPEQSKLITALRCVS